MNEHRTAQLGEPGLRFSWGSVSVVLCGVSLELAEDVANELGLGPPVSDPESPCDVVVTDCGQGARVVVSGGRQHAVASTIDLVLLLSTLLPALLMDRAGVSRRMHAAGVRCGDGVIVISGEGRTGKSSLALEAWLLGFELLGDDWLLFSEDFSGMLPVPKPLKTRMTLSQFETRTPPGGWKMARFGTLFGETRVLIGRRTGFYNAWEQPLPVRALVFLADPNAAGAPLERISIAEALPLIMAQTILCKNSKTLSGVAFARAVAARKLPVFLCRRGSTEPRALFSEILKGALPLHQEPRISPASNNS